MANNEPIPYLLLSIFVLCAASFAFTGLLLNTQCMKRYNATFSEAAFVGSFVLSASINAAAHYHTFANLPSLLDVIMYPIGLIVLISGVYTLNKGAIAEDDAKAGGGSSSGEEEQQHNLPSITV